MDPAIPMILPKGIVVNTKEVYKEVAAFSVLPEDKIKSYWHVYTVTNKKLKDPTARRLENFWWHVWGSDRRNLSGRALAKLYEDISVGPAFVTLRGPSNRWEGPDPSSVLGQLPPTPRQGQPPTVPQQQPHESSVVTKTTDGLFKNQVSSASKPQPTHPILKKARAPSAVGPRPTARFVSPHASEDEGEGEGEDEDGIGEQPLQTGSAAAANQETRKAMASPAKKKQSTPRKFVAGSSASKRRPVLSRRPSSQSSTASRESDATSREAASSVGSKASSTQRTVSPIMENARRPAVVSQVSQSTAPRYEEGPSVKAAGKRPATQRSGSSTGHELLLPKASTSFSSESSLPKHENGPMRQTQSILSLPNHMVNIPPPSFGGSSVRSHTNGGASLEDLISPRTMARSHSHQGYQSYRGYQSHQDLQDLQSIQGYGRRVDLGQARGVNQGLFTGATASTTNIAAQGTIIDQSGLSAMPVEPSAFSNPVDTVMPQHRQSLSSILDSRWTPTQPSASASVPLARTKSQLTLLLEREKSRKADKPRSRA